MSLTLKNPHSVLAALASRPRDVVEVRMRSGRPSPAWEEVARRATEERVPVVQSRGGRDEGRRKRRDAEEGRRTPSAEAVVRPRGGCSVNELFGTAASRELDELDDFAGPAATATGNDTGGDAAGGGGHGLWLALDHVQDPHNVGAIFRTAAFFGVRGIVITKDKSAPLNGAVYDVASGGVESVPFSEQTNLARALDVAKDAGLWVVGSSEHADRDVAELERDRDWLLVLGNEEKGMRRLTGERCDVLCRIASAGGPVGSLNVSVAAGILIASLSR